MRRIASPVVPLVAVSVALLAGCATSTNGTGTGPRGPVSTPPRTTSNPPPTLPGPSTATPVTPSTSSSAPTTTAPSSSSASSSSSAPPTGKYSREPSTTAIGDPVLADFCAGATRALHSGGLHAEAATDQYFGGCNYSLRRGGDTQFFLSETSYLPREMPTPEHAKRVTVAGTTVYENKLDTAVGNCQRLLLAQGVAVQITTFASSIGRKSPQLCKTADRDTLRLARDMSGGQLPQRAVASPSVTSIDICKLAAGAHITKDALLRKAELASISFGSACRVSGKAVYMVISTLTASPEGLEHYKVITASGHRVYSYQYSSGSTCYLASKQGSIPGTDRFELLQVYLAASDYKHPPKGLCTHATDIMAKLLDTAGLQ